MQFILNRSLYQRSFPTLWKKAAVVFLFKKIKIASVSNYRPISIPSTFPKIYEFIIHDHVSQNLRSKFNLRQQRFVETKPTATNLATYLDLITHLVCSQLQVDAIWSSSARTALQTHSYCGLST